MSKIAVINPAGMEELHTQANARDLVQHAGWRYKVKPKAASAASASASQAAAREAQEVIDRAGSGGLSGARMDTGADSDSDSDADSDE